MRKLKSIFIQKRVIRSLFYTAVLIDREILLNALSALAPYQIKLYNSVAFASRRYVSLFFSKLKQHEVFKRLSQGAER